MELRACVTILAPSGGTVAYGCLEMQFADLQGRPIDDGMCRGSPVMLLDRCGAVFSEFMVLSSETSLTGASLLFIASGGRLALV